MAISAAVIAFGDCPQTRVSRALRRAWSHPASGRSPSAGSSGDVAQIASRYGLLLSDEAPVTGSPVAPGTVRIVVSRTRASVPGCAATCSAQR